MKGTGFDESEGTTIYPGAWQMCTRPGHDPDVTTAWNPKHREKGNKKRAGPDGPLVIQGTFACVNGASRKK